MKQCSKCKKTKDFDEFYRYTENDVHKGYHSKCKWCQNEARSKHRKSNPALAAANARRHKLKRLYGITPERYEELLKKQNGVCAICEGVGVDGRRLHIDHNHVTGKVRGLLCHDCNRGLGMFKDIADSVQKAADYLYHYSPPKSDSVRSS